MRWLPIALIALMLAAMAWLAAEPSEAGSEGSDAFGSQPIVGGVATAPHEDVFPVSDTPLPFDAGSDDASPTELIGSATARPTWAPAGDLLGRIVDSAGQPISGAEVDALIGVNAMQARGIFFRRPTILVTARSDGRGQFEMSRVPAGEALVLEVNGTRGRHALRTGLAALPDETLDIGDIVLKDGTRVIGVVTDEEGHDVTGADVLLALPGDFIEEMSRRRGCDSEAGTTRSSTRSTQTGSAGEFVFADVLPVHHVIAILAPGFAPWKETLRLDHGKTKTLEVTLDRGAFIGGRTVDAHDRPIAGAHVSAMADGDSLVTCTVSGPDGRFELADVPTKAHTLLAWTPEQIAADGLLVEAGSQDARLVLKPMTQDPELRIQVIDEAGAPASVFALWSTIGDKAYSPRTDSEVLDGFVTFRPWDANRSGWLWADARGRCSQLVELPVPDPSSLIRLQLQPCLAVEGQVFDSVTHAPLAGAELRATILGNVLRDGDTAWSDEDGRFRIDNLPPGEVRLTARIAGHRENTFWIRKNDSRALELSLWPRSTVVLHANADWQRQLRGRASVRVRDFHGNIVVEQDCGQLPCVVSAVDSGSYTVEIKEIEVETPSKSEPLGFDVPASGMLRVDVSSLALQRSSP